MKHLLILVALVALLAVFATVIAADDSLPNNPHVNPDANACLTGGALEGKCDDDPEMWIGGWYLIRYQYHIVTKDQVPPAYHWMLPVEEVTEVAPPKVVKCRTLGPSSLRIPTGCPV